MDFLKQQEPRLSPKEAEEIVDELLELFGIRLDKQRKKVESIILNEGNENEQKVRYFDLVKSVRISGVCNVIQSKIDRQDIVFGGTFGMSTPNSGMSLTTEWAGYSRILKGPCRTVPTEFDLSEDIEFYKEETCVEISDHNFEMCFRNFRGYLFSTFALIDGYLNRHILFFEHRKYQSEKFNHLKNSRNTEERIELFVDEFCNFDFDEIRGSLIWSDFKKLKTMRNEIVHAVDPYLGLEIRNMATYLNLSINGVGALLRKLQYGQRRPSLTFIERVRTSPIIHFNEITLRSDGKHKQKLYRNIVKRL